jgi:uncharacterized protein (DUF1810 family)
MSLAINLAGYDAAISVIKRTRQCSQHVRPMDLIFRGHYSTGFCSYADRFAVVNGEEKSAYSKKQLGRRLCLRSSQYRNDQEKKKAGCGPTQKSGGEGP